ncbi:hypothetical protein C2G38_2250197 [Gigaspora rosea]|uniref:Uncharacterized protein n=1 Tax=Gigaspora rosea TaxID=44941 RepID=A0A397URF3_9GLOM|nr:hypothetical protein C2G38_2250197 [Gigaspora rosea]
MDIISLMNHEDDNYERIDKLSYEPSNELNYEPIEELLSYNTIKGKNSEDNYYELMDEILSDNASSIMIDLENNNEDESEQVIYLITEQLRVKEIIHLLLPMEYPPTSEDEIAIVYNIEAWNNSEAFINNIQYKLGRPCGGGDADIYCPFLKP